MISKKFTQLAASNQHCFPPTPNNLMQHLCNAHNELFSLEVVIMSSSLIKQFFMMNLLLFSLKIIHKLTAKFTISYLLKKSYFATINTATNMTLLNAFFNPYNTNILLF